MRSRELCLGGLEFLAHLGVRGKLRKAVLRVEARHLPAFLIDRDKQKRLGCRLKLRSQLAKLLRRGNVTVALAGRHMLVEQNHAGEVILADVSLNIRVQPGGQTAKTNHNHRARQSTKFNLSHHCTR